MLLVWCLFHNILSQGFGVAATRAFHFPRWVTPALAFNNTTSLPLLLVQSLASTGVLSRLFQSSDDSVSDVVTRARSYFLVSSVVGNTLTFGLGKGMIGIHNEDAADEMDRNLHERTADLSPYARANRSPGAAVDSGESTQGRDSTSQQEADEETSLLPSPVLNSGKATVGKFYRAVRKVWDRLPPALRQTIARANELISPPGIGALVGAILGTTPPLHRLFFAETNEGGYFKGWLTSSIKNIGELFVVLQVIVPGVKLAHSLRRMRRGESSGSLPLSAVTFTLLVRFILWPMYVIEPDLFPASVE